MNQANKIHHVKVAHNGEFRRFTLQSFKFDELESTLRKLYSLGSSPFVVKFEDDEKDWVVISSDEELRYAVELSGTPIRLTIVAKSARPTPVVETPAETPAETSEDIAPEVQGCALKFTRGRGRAMRGMRGRGMNSPIILERLNAKHERISGRIAVLEEELKTPELPSERERTLLWKLAQAKHKLAFVEQRKQRLESTKETPEVTPTDDEHNHPVGEEGWRKRGNGCGRGRGCRGRGRFIAEPMDPEAAREAIKSFRQIKADLLAARKSADVEAIAANQFALRQAKPQKKQALFALLSAQKEKKRECCINLRKARQAGDEAQIKECEKAFAQAVIELKRAKEEVLA